MKNTNIEEVAIARQKEHEEVWNKVRNSIAEGQIVSGVIKNIRTFGVFIEIECGLVGLLHIEDISVSRMKTPNERFYNGQKINVMIKSIDDEKKRVVLSYKELLGNWEENAEGLEEKTIVDGIIKEADKYKNGIFVELKPNLVGMAEYREDLKYGQKVKVLIKKIIKSKKKIKVVIV